MQTRHQCDTCGHPLKWHRNTHGDCLHDDCPCKEFIPTPERGPKYKPLTREEAVVSCAACRLGQHTNCVGTRIKTGHSRSPKSPRVPCECPFHERGNA